MFGCALPLLKLRRLRRLPALLPIHTVLRELIIGQSGDERRRPQDGYGNR